MSSDAQKPSVLFIIDRVKHWSSRAWLMMNAAAAWHHSGGRVLLAIDCPKHSNRNGKVSDSRRMKPEMIVEKAAEQGLTEYITLPIGRKKPKIWKPGYWRAIRELAATIEREEIDVVHIHRRSHKITTIVAGHLARRHVAIVRGCARSDRNLDHGLPYRLLYPWVDAVTGFSREMVEANRKVSGIDPEICYELPVALPRDFTNRKVDYQTGRQRIADLFGLEDLSDRKVVGLIGALELKKRAEKAVFAAAKLKERFPNLLLLIMGRQEPRGMNRVRNAIAETGLHDIVKIFPSAYASEIPAILAGLDVGLYLARHSSGPSRIVLEYMSQATPTVATNVGVIEEYHQRDPGTFAMIPKENVDAVVQAVTDYLEHPEKARETGLRGAALIQNEFTLDAAAKRLETIYEAALKRRKP